MDKRKVIAAYRRGHMTLRECAQLLGIETELAADLIGGGPSAVPPAGKRRSLHSAGG